MKNKFRLAFAAALLTTVAAPVLAADLPSTKSAPVYAPIDDSFDPFLIRVRALGVLPNGSGSTHSGGPIYDASKLSNNVVPEVDFTYFITKHWAVEVIAGMAHHDPDGRSDALRRRDHNIANTTLLPPTVDAAISLRAGPVRPLSRRRRQLHLVP